MKQRKEVEEEKGSGDEGSDVSSGIDDSENQRNVDGICTDLDVNREIDSDSSNDQSAIESEVESEDSNGDSEVESGDSSDSEVESDECDDSNGDSEVQSDECDESDEDEDPQLKCAGKPYVARHVLRCKLHALLYEIECNRISNKAKAVVHEEMGRGHSSLPESKFNVLTRFRSKSVNLHQLHYEFITNIGLCQSNMTFMYKVAGNTYHWMRELYTLLRLPIPDGIEEIWAGENERRMKALLKKRTTVVKSARAKQKQKRLQESEQR